MKKIEEIKETLKKSEDNLHKNVLSIVLTCSKEGRKINLCLTDRFYRITKKARIWLSNEFITAVKNYEYGLDDKNPRSLGGKDGIFLVDRNFKPTNEMIRKLYNKFLDKEGSEAAIIARELGVPIETLWGVRLVSHHLRLLGIYCRKQNADYLILIDYDDSK